jgi:hypothetical protein
MSRTTERLIQLPETVNPTAVNNYDGKPGVPRRAVPRVRRAASSSTHHCGSAGQLGSAFFCSAARAITSATRLCAFASTNGSSRSWGRDAAGSPSNPSGGLDDFFVRMAHNCRPIRDNLGLARNIGSLPCPVCHLSTQRGRPGSIGEFSHGRAADNTAQDGDDSWQSNGAAPIATSFKQATVATK